MEFMDFMGRNYADDERAGMNTEPVPESSACFISALYFFNESLHHSAGDISELRSACVCNDKFGILAAKHQFNEYFQNLLPISLSAVKGFEEVLSYTFNDKEVLLEALTYGNSIRSLNYQRLEVIGDAALEFLAALQFFKQSSLYHSAGDISQLR
ncbi:hypothetical protein DAPPUDRAFT_329840 [Daphnia pulex]|uniref:RNase III domain-containing protein n=1 Tax=Daphnia pulex TaxID=6669 RepID=E9HHS0_DAPPU|nr:hypothetical protein DAPPUDRAFT_329840 [Daphnia pulex]|eukprot:EFX68678.1 hypothetical protein DAPPUDRAFT_329840 [Daphnia pulex]